MSRALYDIFLMCGGAVSTDSRIVGAGSLFFALRGGRFDGNRFAADALDRGAGFAVVDDPRVAVDERYLVVGDTLLALQHLAAHHRRALGIPILAITGTNGKTTTKELVARVLGSDRRVRATEGNLNNHIGVPLTLLAMRAGDFGVVEMGASAAGEIAALCEIAAPDYGLITNIGRAHLEGFGGPEGVRRAKGELYDYLAAHGGVAFVDGADPVLVSMVPEGLKVRWYRAAEDFESQLAGAYNAGNIAAAVAVGREFGVPEADIRAAIKSYAPDNNRSQRVDTAKNNTLILDCYNANPSSMRAALTDFASLPSELPRAVILGDMAELGSFAATEHEEILALLAELGIGEAYLVGPHFTDALRRLPEVPDTAFETFADTAALGGFLRLNPLAGRLVLLKGSRSVGLEALRELL